MIKKGWFAFSILAVIAAFSTSLFIFRSSGVELFPTNTLGSRSEIFVLMRFGSSLEDSSYLIAPTSWLMLGVGAWIWRGKTRTAFQNAGFDKEVFRLLLKMKGGGSRVRLLKALLVPKDRMQLAKEVGLDWKAVDRHTKMLQEYGLIHEEAIVGRNIRLFTLTKMGEMLLSILDKMDEFEKECHTLNFQSDVATKSEIV